LRELSKRKNYHFRKGLVGDDWEGVVIRQKNGIAQILTSNYVQVHIFRCAAEEREQVQIKITQAEENQTRGKIID